MFAISDGWRSGTAWLGLTALLSSLSPFSHAGELTVAVLDAAGDPVEHAAISLHAEFAIESTVAARTVVVDQDDRQFRPWVTAITAGDRVVFANSDEITHHVYSFSPAR